MDFISNTILPLILPFFSTIAIFYMIQAVVPGNSPRREPREAQDQGNITINVFKGTVRESYEVAASSTPDQLKNTVFTRDQLSGKSIVFVCNGRRLQQNVSLGTQGVRNNSHLYTQIIDAVPSQSFETNSHSLITLAVCGTGILTMWIFYFVYPKYFTFMSRFLLIVFTEFFIGYNFFY